MVLGTWTGSLLRCDVVAYQVGVPLTLISPTTPNGPLAVEQYTCVSPTSVCWGIVARCCLVLRSCLVRTGSKAYRAGFQNIEYLNNLGTESPFEEHISVRFSRGSVGSDLHAVAN